MTGLPDESDAPAVAALSQPLDVAAAAPEDMARALARGVSRMLGEAGHTCLCEFTLRNGRRADVIAMAPDGSFTIVEIKTSANDFRADGKWPEYLDFCDLFYFAVRERFPQRLIPRSCGLIVADAYGAAVLRPAEETRLNGARRKALTLRFAETAGRRLMRLLDPAALL
ncbi:MAG: MmcB family DNA repair protein [Geminicoccales bacterium]